MPQHSSPKIPFYLRNEAVYVLVWLIVFLAPVLAMGYGDSISTHQWVKGWLRLLPYLLIFVIHQYYLAPQFLLKMQWGRYVIWLTVLIFMVHIGDFLAHPIIEKYLNISMIPRRMMRRQAPPFIHLFMSHVFISYLVAGMGASVLLFRKWIDRERAQKEIQQELLQSSLNSLRHQISPHFFMNTLNNIHALIPQNPQGAQDACIRLSRMMRYMLYGTDSGFTTLKGEFEFIKSYFDLMSIRFTESVETRLNLPDHPIPSGKIPVLLLVSFIENAFKHGISYEQPSFVYVQVRLNSGELIFTCENSIQPQGQSHGKDSGIGLENVRKRLELIYPNQHFLSIENLLDVFRVQLRIPYEAALPSR